MQINLIKVCHCERFIICNCTEDLVVIKLFHGKKISQKIQLKIFIAKFMSKIFPFQYLICLLHFNVGML